MTRKVTSRERAQARELADCRIAAQQHIERLQVHIGDIMAKLQATEQELVSARQGISARDELLRVERQLQENLTLQKGRADEQASETYAHLQQVMQLAQERGKVISILVQKINDLESA